MRKRQDKAREYFDELAGKFGRSYVPGRSWEALAHVLITLLPPLTVADLGAGEGTLAQLLAKNARKVIAVDNSPKMVEFASQLAKKHGLRFMYGRDEVVLILVTYSVFLILEDVIKLVWGVESYSAYQPYGLLGNFDVGDLPYTVYDALLVVVAVLVGVALTFVLTRTRQGKLLLAVIHDREISAAMGINVERVYLVTFTIGTMLAALGGALIAPKVSVVPAMGVEVIVLAFAVVVIGGLGSLPGAALGALIVGLVRSAAVHYLPEVELFSIYLVMALVLIVRPKGLFSAVEARKI